MGIGNREWELGIGKGWSYTRAMAAEWLTDEQALVARSRELTDALEV